MSIQDLYRIRVQFMGTLAASLASPICKPHVGGYASPHSPPLNVHLYKNSARSLNVLIRKGKRASFVMPGGLDGDVLGRFSLSSR
ncbi:hypothetical protein C7Y71_000940 [Pseudoprevotella muciniphila]|uniref:Uncharacterized protein n=1 Tax=Pseudoprevotella muciniphila TaxID=2133944 RepID=A0A5P8E459_9BACT|nr:hypothetical protein C7Y71_000940 [Pseudoprevotella muciniphila]